MRRSLRALAIAGLLLGGTAQAAPAPLASLIQRVDIPFAQFTLANGLRVVVHTDRKAPLVSVGVWYDVGSIDEPPGKSGFAHLFEHLMFYGSAHQPGNLFTPLEEIGATDFNGTTNFDRTNYFETVPTPALDLALFLESDRMGFLLPGLSQQKLDAQRKVVLNEKRQGENAPGGLVRYELLKQLFPPDNPMSMPTIGTPADLDAATLADARHWFASHYGPNNAVLVLAGDIDAATARPLVEKWFGEIPPGPTPARFAGWVPARTATTRATMHDRVPTIRLSRFWAVPGRADAADVADLQVALAILGDGPTSRLRTALVRDRRLAVSVGAGVADNVRAGIASLSVELAPGVNAATVEPEIDRILEEFLRTGPTADEVDRVAMRVAGGTIYGLEKVGGLGGKGAALAEGLLFDGDPASYRRDLADFASATPGTVRRAAEKWLRTGDFRLTLLPGARDPQSVRPPAVIRTPASLAAPPAPAALAPPANRSQPPAAGAAPTLRLPAIVHATLANGLPVTFARTTAVPVVRILLSIPGGIAADSRAHPGTQAMMLGLLSEGSNGRLGPLDGPEIARRTERLGAGIGASASLDRLRFQLSALSPNLADSLQLFADVVRSPTFPANQLERVRVQRLTALQREASSPNGLAIRALPALVYGPGHPYGQSFTGNGTAAGLQAVTRADLLRYHASALATPGAQLFVVGDTTPGELLPLLNAAFGDLPATPAALAPVPPPRPQAPGRIVFIDYPGTDQSVILAAAADRLSGTDDILATSLATDIFGGLASARLNMELREKRNWSYGAYASLAPTRGPMPFLITAPVETDATGASLAAIRRMLQAYEGTQPPTAAELQLARDSLVRGLPGDHETGGAILAMLERSANLGRPDDYVETLPARAAALTPADIARAPLPQAKDLVWIVVGDKARVLPQLQQLQLPLEVRAGTAKSAD